MSTNKVHGDAPNEIRMTELKTRWHYADAYKYGIPEMRHIDQNVFYYFTHNKLLHYILSPLIRKFRKPDFEKFPNFPKARYFECVIEAGEILFIPVFWWHQIYSLENSNNKLNISVNFWSKPPISQFFTPPGRGLAAQIPYILKKAFNL